MILVAVVVGYILGITPFIYREIRNIVENRTIKVEENNQNDDAKQILDEWLNGKSEVPSNKKNQQDIFNEYMTGQEVSKED